MLFTRWLRCVLLCLIAVPAMQASPAGFEPTSAQSQLPQSSIYALIEDQFGYIWVGTREGLSRWDGQQMRSWGVGQTDEVAIPGRIVDAVVEDSQGDIWIRSRSWDRQPGDIAKLDFPAFETVQTFDNVRGATLARDRDGIIYAAHRDGVFRYDAATGRFVYWIDLAKANVDDIADFLLAEDGSAFIAFANGQVFAGDETGWRKIELSGVPASRVALFEDRDGQIWASAERLFRLSSDRQRFAPVSFPVLTSAPDHTPRLTQLRNGHLLVATLWGAVQYDPTRDKVVEHHKLQLAGVRDNQQWVLHLLEDRAGGLWAGSLWGLQYLDTTPPLFSLVAPSSGADRPNASNIASVLEHSDGSLWLSTFGAGHTRISADRKTSSMILGQDVQSSWAWMMAEQSNGDVLAALQHLRHVDQSGARVLGEQQLPTQTQGTEFLLAVRVAPDQSIWYLTNTHVGRLDEQGQARPVFVPTRGETTALLADDNSIWIGTTERLLRLQRGHEEQPVLVEGDVNVVTLYHGSKGIWAGTPKGLHFFPLGFEDGRFFASSLSPSTSVNCVVEDNLGYVWYSSSRGIVRLDPADPGAAQRVFLADDGIGNDEFNRNACIKDRAGRLYFGGNRGVTEFAPGAVTAQESDIPLRIAKVTVRGAQGKRMWQGPLQRSLLIDSDVHTINFQLAALKMPSSVSMHYVTQLTGFDEDWVEQGPGGSIRYTNLPPGDYTFLARTRNANGLFSAHRLSVPLQVLPAYWQTWWFRLIAVLAGIFAVVTFAWLILSRRYQRRLSELKTIEARDRERARISRDMHDEIGAGLTEISILSELAQREMSKPVQASSPDRPAATQRIGSILRRSRRMLEAMSEIIWATDPRNDDAPRFVAYLREYAGQFLDHADLAYQLEFDCPELVHPLHADFRRSILLILKEALNNVVRHAQATSVRVTLSVADRHLRLTVADNGQTTAKPLGDKGHGLHNMKSRADKLGGTFSFEHKPDGAVVALSVPLPESP